MALSIQLNLTDAQEAALNDVVNDYNAKGALVIGFTQVTPTQYVRNVLRDHIESRVAALDESKQLTLQQAYKKATAPEKAQIDTILNKYRT